MNDNIKELWLKFEHEFLAALSHSYNDEAEYIKPLRDAIMGIEAATIFVYGFAITPLVSVSQGHYRVHYDPDYVGLALSKQGVVALIKLFINEQNAAWIGPTPEQFELKFWQVAGALE